MAVLPAISRSWCTRANIPIPNNSSTRNVGNSFLWNLKECLLNTLGGGTLTGVRHANSVWTVVRSCDGVAYGATEDGVDRIGTPYNSTKFVRNSTSSAHSWIILRNSYIGHDMLISCNANSDTTSRVAFTPTSSPFGTGSVTADPPTTSFSFQFGSNADSTTTATINVADVTSGATFYSHFIADDFGNFIYLWSKVGSGIFSGMVSLIQSVGAHPSDTFNRFAFGGTATSTSTSLGTPYVSSAHGPSGCTSRAPDGGANSGGVTALCAGSATALSENNWKGDSLTNEVRFVQAHVFSNSPLAYRGVLPDIYEVIGGGVGVSYPNVASQTWISAGNYLLPFLSTQPLL
jgi:hypothetical protein